MFDFYRLKGFMLTAICSIVVLAVTFVGLDIRTIADNECVYLPILMYHHIQEVPSRLNKYTISPEEFENDLKHLRDNGYSTVTLSQLFDYTESKCNLPKKPVLITFDDGYESVYVYAYKLLKKYKMTAVVNVIGRYADLYSESDDHSVRYSHITWEQLREISNDGTFEVGSHTYDMHKVSSRRGIAKKSGESDTQYELQVGGDLSKMQQLCREKLGYSPRCFAYPFGSISKQALPIIKKQEIKMIFCCWEKVNLLTRDSEQLYHLNRFNRPHGVSTAEFFSKIEKSLP